MLLDVRATSRDRGNHGGHAPDQQALLGQRRAVLSQSIRWDGVQIIGVDDAIGREPVVSGQWKLAGQRSDHTSYFSDGEVLPPIKGVTTGDHYDRPESRVSCQLGPPHFAAGHLGEPPRAHSVSGYKSDQLSSRVDSVHAARPCCPVAI